MAVKILTGYATGLNREHKLRELEVLQRLSSVNDHCAKLLTQFVHPGFDDDGEHLCLVTELYSSSIQDTLEAHQDGYIPVPAVKQILLRHVLLGIARLHMCGIAHTGMFYIHGKCRRWLMQCKLFSDIKLDNIMINLESHWSTEAIDTWFKENPPRTYAPERSLNKMVSAYVSQSLPSPLLDALLSCNFKLADFSSGTSDELWHIPSYAYITFSSVCIWSNDRWYHTPWPTGPWSRTWRGMEWICRYMDLRLYGEPLSVCRDTYLTCGCARCSLCLPIDPFLNQWNPLKMMRRKSTYCFSRWSFFVGKFSWKIFFGA